MTKNIEKITKQKQFKRVEPEKLIQEIEKIVILAGNVKAPERVAYNLHKVPITGKPYLAGDAKYLNRVTHQSGRGKWRYLFNKDTYKYEGLAFERDNGNYRRIV